MDINITIENKHCTVLGTPVIVCGNSDYTITFNFDEEWETAEKKTARFSYVRDGARKKKEVEFTGNTVAVPPVYRTRELQVGVYVGDLVTSTSARIPCKKSAVCDTCTPDDLDPNQYKRMHDQLTEELTTELADKLAPALVETGAIVTCEPVEGYPLEVAADPEAATITRCGKNLFDDVKFYTDNEFVRQEDGTWYGTHKNKIIFTNSAHIPGPFTISFYAKRMAASLVFLIYYTDGTSVYSGSTTLNEWSSAKFTTDANKTVDYIRWIHQNAGDYYIKYVQLEYGSTATPYEPFKGADNFNIGETIPAFAGVNTLWGDVGEITVTGRADPTAVINKLTNAILALGGNI